ncbi:MAG: Holliday junction resolvase RuvX [Candidatus Dormibacteraceae bacterium]
MARTMAVDPGAVRVGIALSDPLGIVAQPHSTVAAEPAATLPARLAELARALEARDLVVGLPYRLDGSEGPEAKAARRLAHDLRREARLPVALVDERLTSVAAERALLASGRRRAERRRLSDQVAAALILQTHLDGPRRRRS